MKILIAIKTSEPDSDSPHPKKTHELFERQWDEGWKPERIKLPNKSENDCERCNGKGISHVECDTCEGSGRHRCECGDDHECGCCVNGYIESDSDERCVECIGSGKAFENPKYGVTYFDGHYIAKIVKHLPNPKVVEIATESRILRFNFDGGKGLLMGVRLGDYK